MNLEVSVNGIDFQVEFDYQPKEAQTLTYPGCNESVEVTGVSMLGVEIGEIISSYWLGRIEEELMEMC